MMNFSEARDAVNKAKSVLIFAHRSPDGDALGSMAAMGLALKGMGKIVDYVPGDINTLLAAVIPETCNFLGTKLKNYDLAVVVDSSSADYAFGFDENRARCKEVLVIDHHETNELYGNINIVNANSAACCEIVYRFLQALGIVITKDIARAIFVGISTDTGSFVYSNTTAETHRIVAELYEKYDDFFEVAEHLKMKSQDTVSLLKIGLNHCSFYNDGKFLVSVLLFKDGYVPGTDNDPLIDIIRYIDGVEVAVLVRQTGEDSFKLSFRSADERYDVSGFCKSHGGGGHAKAAGFNYEGSFDELKILIEDYFNTI